MEALKGKTKVRGDLQIPEALNTCFFTNQAFPASSTAAQGREAVGGDAEGEKPKGEKTLGYLKLYTAISPGGKLSQPPARRGQGQEAVVGAAAGKKSMGEKT